MDPSVQKYLTTTYINRSEDDTEKSMINPPEAFLLASLYINGYGVDRDEVKATRWLAAAWRAKHPLAGAYTYRIARAIDAKLGNPAQVEELLELMAIRGSRIALQDLAALSPSRYDRTKKTVRDVLAGTGADFFFQKNMLHGFNHGSWMMTFSNIPILLQNFGRLNRVADYTANKRGDRILHIAASCGQTEAIEALLGRFDVLQVNQLNDQGETPLLCACRAGQKGTVLWLTEHGADASVAANNGEAPLHWLISFDNEDVYTVGKALIRAGAKVTAKTATFVAHHADFPTTLVSDRLPQGFPIGWGEQLALVALGELDVYLTNNACSYPLRPAGYCRIPHDQHARPPDLRRVMATGQQRPRDSRITAAR